jgi:hypothetical protein
MLMSISIAEMKLFAIVGRASSLCIPSMPYCSRENGEGKKDHHLRDLGVRDLGVRPTLLTISGFLPTA